MSASVPCAGCRAWPDGRTRWRRWPDRGDGCTSTTSIRWPGRLEPDRPALAYSYFEERQPYVDDSDQTYTDAARPLTNQRTYEWNHSIGEVVTALVERGMRIDRLVEHDWTVHQQFPWLVESAPGQWSAGDGYPRLPLTYTVVATRTP